MRIDEARAAVIAKCQNFRPTMDFPVPNSLIDFLLFQESALAMRNARVVVPAEWMYTDFDDMEARQDGAKWVVDLPFTPLDIFDAIGTVSMKSLHSSRNAIMLQKIAYSAISVSDGMVNPPSNTHPAFSPRGNKIYLLGRSSFDGCSLSVSAIPGGILEGYDCSPDMNLPIPHGLGGAVLDAAAKGVIEYISGKREDKTEDSSNE